MASATPFVSDSSHACFIITMCIHHEHRVYSQQATWPRWFPLWPLSVGQFGALLYNRVQALLIMNANGTADPATSWQESLGSGFALGFCSCALASAMCAETLRVTGSDVRAAPCESQTFCNAMALTSSGTMTVLDCCTAVNLARQCRRDQPNIADIIQMVWQPLACLIHIAKIAHQRTRRILRAPEAKSKVERHGVNVTHQLSVLLSPPKT